jgi:hypothetical protein
MVGHQHSVEANQSAGGPPLGVGLADFTGVLISDCCRLASGVRSGPEGWPSRLSPTMTRLCLRRVVIAGAL